MTRRVNQTAPKLIHCIATCTGCAWSAEGYKTAEKNAAAHVLETRHTVIVERGTSYRITPWI